MSNFEYNFDENQLSLIQSSSWDAEQGHQEVQLPYYFNELKGDYIRVSIFDADNNFVISYDSNDEKVKQDLLDKGLQFIYRDKTPESVSDIQGQITTGKIFIKANELLKLTNLDEGKYKLRVDFLRNVFSSIFTEPENYIYNSDLKPSEGTFNVGNWNDVFLSSNDNLDTTDDQIGPYQYGQYTDGDGTFFSQVWDLVPEDELASEVSSFRIAQNTQSKIWQNLHKPGDLNTDTLEPGTPYLFSAFYRVGQANGGLLPVEGDYNFEESKVSYGRATWPYTNFQNTTGNTTPDNEVNLKNIFLDSKNLGGWKKLNLKFIANYTEHETNDVTGVPTFDYSLSTGNVATNLNNGYMKIYNPLNPDDSIPGKRVFVYNPHFAAANNLNETQHLGEYSIEKDRLLSKIMRPSDFILGPDYRLYTTANRIDRGRINVYDNTSGIHTEQHDAPGAYESEAFDLGIAHTQIQKGWNDEGYVETYESNIPANSQDDYSSNFKAPKFLVKEISNSRKEIRLIIRNDASDIFFSKDFISKWNAVLGTLHDENYGFDYVLNFQHAKSLVITNYAFDDLSEENADSESGELVSLILRLNEPLPNILDIWDEVKIEKELITTHIQKVYYFPDSVKSRGGDGLAIDEEYPFDTSLSTDTVVLQSYDDLITSSSLNRHSISTILSESKDIDNINIDYNEFSNHTIYGSVSEKLTNFYQKVSTLEGYYNELSSSLLQYEDINFDVKDELVYNGDMTSSIDGWQNHTAEPFDTLEWSSVSQSIYAVSDGSADGDSYNIMCTQDSISLVEGRKYRYQYRLTLVSGTTPSVTIKDNCGSTARHTIQPTNTTGTSLNQGTFWATHTEDATIQFHVASNAATEFYVDDVSVAEIYTEKNTSQVVNRRKELFEEIREVKQNFTPYEKFLYYDGQSESTASAPNLRSLTLPTDPLSNSQNSGNSGFPWKEELYDWNGFEKSYKIVDTNMKNFATVNGGGAPGKIPIFNHKYDIADKPFFNYSGPLYLSFLHKGESSFDWQGPSGYNHQGLRVPGRAEQHSVSESFDTITSSKWHRSIIVASQSHWRPKQGWTLGGGANPITQFGSSGDDVQWELLNPSDASGSHAIQVYGDYTQLSTEHIESGDIFTGSILPSNKIFGIYAKSGSNANITSSYLTDIKISRNNPTNTLPFSSQYRTGSTEFNNWWTDISASAVTYDNDNVHSIHKNLPLIYQDKVNQDVLYKFVSLLGDFFDTQKTLVDTTSTLADRGYSKYDSPPTEYLSDIASSLGWNLISPFSSSLSDYYGTGEEDIKVESNTIADVERNTYRKLLNNILYIYKTKGTANAYRALMNIYGYPPDVFKIQELGTSLEEHNPAIITGDVEDILDGIQSREGNIGFTKKTKELVSYIFNRSGSSENLNKFNTDWYSNDATPECIEFTFKPAESTNDQILLQNSGSTSDYWNLTLEASGSTTASRGRLVLSINNSSNAASVIASNRVTCSTNYLDIKNNKHWNVKLNRTIATASTQGVTQSYEIFLGLQNDDKITNFSTASLISSNSVVNHNFTSSAWASDNLVWGKQLTGSISNIKAWNENLNTSKFKQHILNKFSTTGNSLSSSRNNLIYHYKLNEKYREDIHLNSGSLTFADSNPNNVKDYSKTKAGTDLFYSSSVYDTDLINSYIFTIRSTGFEDTNDNKIVTNPNTTIIKPLNPEKYTQQFFGETDFSSPTRLNSNIIEIVRSPQSVLNDYLINSMADTDLTQYFGNPQDLYKDEYSSLKTLHKESFDDMGVTLDVNKWLDAQEGIFSEALIDNVQKIIPAKAELTNVGVLFEPSILERDKIKNPSLGYELLGKSGSLEAILPTTDAIYQTVPEGTLNSVENIHLTESAYEPVREPVTPINFVTDTFGVGGNKETIYGKSSTLNVTDNFVFTDSYNVTSSIGTISYDGYITETGTADGDEKLKSSASPSRFNNNNTKLSVSDTYNLTGLKDNAVVGNNIVVTSTTVTAEHKTEKQGTYGLVDNVTLSPTYEASYDCTLNQFNILATETVDDLSKKWGRTIDDVHFVNMVAGTGSGDSYNNVNHYERLSAFQMIGDYEIISASKFSNGESYTDYENIHFFQNRQLVIDGLNKGKEIGKTSHFITGSDGTITYPSNHINNNPDPFHQRMIDGNQHVGSKFFNVPDKDDLSTSSFYRIKITGENKLIVRRNKQISDDTGSVRDIR